MLLKTVRLVCFIFYIPLLSAQVSDTISIYIVKQRWHTGIVIKITDITPGTFPEITDNFYTDYVDIGWGDNDFYREPGFDLGLAIKALFYPTKSVLRVEGFRIQIEHYLGLSDKAVKISMDKRSFDSLCLFIKNTFDEHNGREEIVEVRGGGQIVFFGALGKYYLFNTCNTWAAKALAYSGLEISTKIILAEELFNQLEIMPWVLRLK